MGRGESGDPRQERRGGLRGEKRGEDQRIKPATHTHCPTTYAWTGEWAMPEACLEPIRHIRVAAPAITPWWPRTDTWDQHPSIIICINDRYP